jgi:hypothetical protein
MHEEQSCGKSFFNRLLGFDFRFVERISYGEYTNTTSGSVKPVMFRNMYIIYIIYANIYIYYICKYIII